MPTNHAGDRTSNTDSGARNRVAARLASSLADVSAGIVRTVPVGAGARAPAAAGGSQDTESAPVERERGVTLRTIALALLFALPLIVSCSDGDGDDVTSTSGQDASAAEVDEGVGAYVSLLDPIRTVTPSCDDEPVSGDWCVISGAAPVGGTVRISGGVFPLSYAYPDDSFTARVLLPPESDEHVEVTVVVTDDVGQVFEEEVVRVTRVSPFGSSTATGHVYDSSNFEPIEGAIVEFAGTAVETASDGAFVIEGVDASADIVRVRAEGYVPLIDLNSRLGGDLTVHGAALAMTPLGTTAPYERGDREVRVGEHARVVFGSDGAMTDGTVALSTGPIGGSHGLVSGLGLPIADVSPVVLGDGGQLRLSLDLIKEQLANALGSVATSVPDEAVSDEQLSMLPIPYVMVDPYTGTSRDGYASVDLATRELVIDTAEIIGEWVEIWPGMIRIEEGGYEHVTTDRVPEHVRRAEDACESDIDRTIVHEVRYHTETRYVVAPLDRVSASAGGVAIPFFNVLSNLAFSVEDVQPLPVSQEVPAGFALENPVWVQRTFSTRYTRVSLSLSFLALLHSGGLSFGGERIAEAIDELLSGGELPDDLTELYGRSPLSHIWVDNLIEYQWKKLESARMVAAPTGDAAPGTVRCEDLAPLDITGSWVAFDPVLAELQTTTATTDGDRPAGERRLVIEAGIGPGMRAVLVDSCPEFSFFFDQVTAPTQVATVGYASRSVIVGPCDDDDYDVGGDDSRWPRAFELTHHRATDVLILRDDVGTILRYEREE